MGVAALGRSPRRPKAPPLGDKGEVARKRGSGYSYVNFMTRYQLMEGLTVCVKTVDHEQCGAMEADVRGITG
jgi:hypothetical protein